MPGLFLEITIRAALIVVGTAIVLYAMRVKVAAVKHRVWTGVMLLMLALPLWTAWGPKAPLRLLPASVERFANAPAIPTLAPTDAPAAQKISRVAIPKTSRRVALTTVEAILLGIYLLGALVMLVRLAIGTMKANRLVRQSALVNGILTSSACAAPVTVGCLRPVVILPEGWREWRKEQLGAVLAHEREHMRRRDPLVQWLTLLNRAIFWFHPAAWWLERELSGLAEESCDAAVIAQGHDPRDYAEALMNMARAVMKSGSRVNLVSMAMPGVRLPERVRKIVDTAPTMRISRARVACLTAICITLCTTFVAVALTNAQSVPVSWESAARGKPSFDVASVKQHPEGDYVTFANFPLGPGDAFSTVDGRFSTTNLPVSVYVAFAYKLTMSGRRAIELQLPKWAKDERFDIEARAPKDATKDEMRLMMRALLADRFKLTVHSETREEPVFALVLVKEGKTGAQLLPHLSSSTPCGSFSPSATLPDGMPSACGIFMTEADGQIRTRARGATMGMIGDSLSSPAAALDRPVVDRTGLDGTFDVTISWVPESATSPGTQSTDAGPTFLEALNDQLGLKLQSTTAPVYTLVIDHIEEPSPN